MPQPRLDQLTDRLLRAGIAPRHVRRYVAELRDHFEDLVLEEEARGVRRDAAEANALSRLGALDDLAGVMLARPELRSFTARFPFAVFGLGPVAMLVASLLAAILVEIGVLDLVGLSVHALGWKPSPRQLGAFTIGLRAWNTLAVYGAPLGIAALIAIIGIRQRVSPIWIATGVAIICALGGFQNLVWYDTGMRGEMSLSTGLLPPYPNFMQGILRTIANLAVAGGMWWFVVRGRMSFGTQPEKMAAE